MRSKETAIMILGFVMANAPGAGPDGGMAMILRQLVVIDLETFSRILDLNSIGDLSRRRDIREVRGGCLSPSWNVKAIHFEGQLASSRLGP